MLSYAPLLQIQQDLYLQPRGMERFGRYLQTTIGGASRTQEVALPPLIAVNPMAREHALQQVEALLALGADDVMQDQMPLLSQQLRQWLPREFRVSLVVLDDRMGGWTNRSLMEAGWDKLSWPLQYWSWITVGYWTVDAPSLQRLLQSLRVGVYRSLYALHHGNPSTLAQIMQLEGQALHFAGVQPTLDLEELHYTQAVLQPLLNSHHFATQFAAMFGDLAANANGYPALGLGERAGFELSLAQALGLIA